MGSRTYLASALLVVLLVQSTAAVQLQNDTAASAASANRHGGDKDKQSGKDHSGSYGSGTDRPGSSPKNPKHYTLDVTVGERSPDCVSRKVVLINGEFQPPLVLTQGDYVEVRRSCRCTWATTVNSCHRVPSISHRLVWTTSNCAEQPAAP
jgi:hypothetical protein